MKWTIFKIWILVACGSLNQTLNKNTILTVNKCNKPLFDWKGFREQIRFNKNGRFSMKNELIWITYTYFQLVYQ